VIDWSNVKFLGSFGSCYLLVEASEGLLVIDQHAFHERIVFERLIANPGILKIGQPLLVPEALDLPPTEVAFLVEHKDRIAELGFDFLKIDQGTIEVLKVPSLLAGKDIGSLFSSLANVNMTGDNHGDVIGLAGGVLATIACHSAIRGGEELGEAEFRALVHEARAVDFYHNCPHGRRVLRWFQRAEVSRWFDRQ
jgi:DNA mismatch repair protein MutL